MRQLAPVRALNVSRWTRLGTLALVLAASASADPKPKTLADELKGSARESFEQAKDLFEHGDFATAHAKYAQTYDLSKHPRLLWNMAACSARLKRYAQATGEAERYLAEGGASLTKEQVARANEAITDWRAFVATATLSLSVAGATVLVDKERIVFEGTERSLLLDMGTHEIQASKTGYESFRDSLVVKTVGKLAIPITLKPAGEGSTPRRSAAAPEASASTAAAAMVDPNRPAAPGTSSSNVLGWTTLGLGVVALAGGAFVHLEAKSAADAFRAACTDIVCKPEAAALYDDYASRSTLASSLYLGGGVLALAGGALLWFGSRDTERPHALRVGVGPRTLTFGGAF